MINERIRNVISGVLRNFQEENNTPSARVVLHHQLDNALSSLILADYSVRVNQGMGDEISGVVFFKTDHEANRFQELSFTITKEKFQVN